MNRIERMKLISEIEKERGSKLLVYMTGDRLGLETRISTDVFPFIFGHLSKTGNQDKIDLLIYTTGGITIAGYGIVNMIREFCKSFNVIIPFKALSTGTLIALGANEILMSKLGQLSPIDPSLESLLGPKATLPNQPNIQVNVPVNVEDVISFFELAKKEANIKDTDALMQTFLKLSDNVHPLTLGAVNRIREQIKFLGKNLLSYHMSDEEKIKNIISILSKERFSHDYIISRREAKNTLGLNIVDISPSLESKISQLFNSYSEILELNNPLNYEALLGSNDFMQPTFHRCIIESLNMTTTFDTEQQIRRTTISQLGSSAPIVAYNTLIVRQGWSFNNSI
jgi:hypothetical protein